MIVFIILSGFVLRLISINQSLWIDEATSALTTKMSVVDLFGKFLPGDFHPPFYYLLLRVWSSLFGSSEVVLRSLSILFGLATIYLMYKLGGRVAALLMATSGLHIYYSQEARMYAMSAFLVSLAIWFFTKILHGKGRVGDWLGFSITLGILGLTDYLPILILPVFWIYGIWTKQKLSWWKKFIVSHNILIILGILWFPIFLKQINAGFAVTATSPAWVLVLGQFSIKEILLIPVKFMIGRVGFDNKILYGMVVSAVGLLYGFSFVKSFKFFVKLKLIYLWLFVPIILALIISIKIPVLNYFRFLFVLPAFYLVAAHGIANLSKNWRKVFVVLLIGVNLVTAGLYLFNKRFQREDWRGVAMALDTNAAVVVFPTKSQQEALKYYGKEDRIVDVDVLGKGYKDVWLMRYAQPISDPEDKTRVKIEDLGYKKVNELDFNGVVVWEYGKL